MTLLVVSVAVLLVLVAAVVALEVDARRRPRPSAKTLGEALEEFQSAQRELGEAYVRALTPAIKAANRALEDFARAWERRR